MQQVLRTAVGRLIDCSPPFIHVIESGLDFTRVLNYLNISNLRNSMNLQGFSSPQVNLSAIPTFPAVIGEPVPGQ